MPPRRPRGATALVGILCLAICIVGAGLLAAALAPDANATIVTLTPIADGDVFNNGITPPVVDTTDTGVGTYSSGIAQRDAIFEFDLSAIPDTASVLAASVEFVLVTHLSGSPHRLIDYPGDGVVNLNDHNHPGNQIAELPIAGTNGSPFTITYGNVSGIIGALAGDLYTLRFDAFGTSTIRIASLEHPSFEPLKLTVEYRQQTPTTGSVPAPPTLPLVLAGIAGGLAVRRRRA